jgi:hypothetical protein
MKLEKFANSAATTIEILSSGLRIVLHLSLANFKISSKTCVQIPQVTYLRLVNLGNGKRLYIFLIEVGVFD